MGWFAYFILHPEEEEKEKKKFYGFKSGRAPPPEGLAVVKPFLNKLLDMANNLTFKKSAGNTFQSRLMEDLEEIKKSKKVIVSADKNRSWYELERTDYKKLVTRNVTKEYKKVNRRDLEEADMYGQNNGQSRNMVVNWVWPKEWRSTQERLPL